MTTPDLLKLLDADGRRVLEQAAKPLHVPAGRILFEEGAPARSLFFVRNGSLGVYVADNAGEARLVYLVAPGETVGEMAVISGEPRSATVAAIRDTDLWVLSRTRFNELLKTNPELMANVMRLLTYRLRQLTNGPAVAIEPRTIAIVPASKGVDTRKIARRLRSQILQFGDKVHVLGDQAANYSAEWFAERERRHDFIIMAAEPGDGAWLSVCARQADRVLLVADVDARGRADIPETLLKDRARHQLLDLVLVHGSNRPSPTGTHHWRNAHPSNRHFHLRQSVDGDWARLARVLCGRANGLVLSGGAARGFAQIGVIRALEEAGVPIDFVGGTSMGGVIGSCLGLEMSADEMTERVREAFVDQNPVSDYTLPFVGLVRGRRVERLLEEKFGNWCIEDMWRPFYCVSSNLTHGGLHVHREGLLRDALRASISLPGIFPPVPHEDGLLVDGAVTCNLPVSMMRATHRGKVIAIDVARDLAITPNALAAEQTGNWYQRIFRPPIVSILIRAGSISSEEADRREARMADLLITPPLGEIELRDWKAFDRAVEIGYRHGCEVLATVGDAFVGCKDPDGACRASDAD